MNDQTQAVATTFPPPEDEDAVIEYGMRRHHRMKGEIDVLKAQVDSQAQANKLLEIENEGLHRQLAEEISRRLSAESARDEAVAARAELEAVILGVSAIVDRFQVASKPLRAKGVKRLPEGVSFQGPVQDTGRIQNGANGHA